jgi:hypothetical protein
LCFALRLIPVEQRTELRSVGPICWMHSACTAEAETNAANAKPLSRLSCLKISPRRRKAESHSNW